MKFKSIFVLMVPHHLRRPYPPPHDIAFLLEPLCIALDGCKLRFRETKPLTEGGRDALVPRHLRHGYARQPPLLPCRQLSQLDAPRRQLIGGIGRPQLPSHGLLLLVESQDYPVEAGVLVVCWGKKSEGQIEERSVRRGCCRVLS